MLGETLGRAASLCLDWTSSESVALRQRGQVFHGRHRSRALCDDGKRLQVFSPGVVKDYGRASRLPGFQAARFNLGVKESLAERSVFSAVGDCFRADARAAKPATLAFVNFVVFHFNLSRSSP
jgi:hypothetical protein